MIDDLGQFPSLDPNTGKLRPKHVPIPEGVASSEDLEKFESQIDLIDGVFWAGSGPPSATWIKAVRHSGKTPLDLKQVRKGERLYPRLSPFYDLLIDVTSFDPLTGAPIPATVNVGNVRGAPGLNGSNVLPTDEAIAQALAQSSSETSEQMQKLLGDYSVDIGNLIADGSLTDPTLSGIRGTELFKKSRLAYTKGSWYYKGIEIGSTAAVASTSNQSTNNASLFENRIRLNPEYTNRIANANMSGASLGVVGSGGSFPTDWVNLGNGIPKTMVSIGTGRIAWTVPPQPGLEYGGVRVPLNLAVNGVISFRATMSNVPPSALMFLRVRWWRPGGTITTFINRAVTSNDPVGIRFEGRVPPGPTSDSTLVFEFQSDSVLSGGNLGFEIRDLMLTYGSETGDMNQPEWNASSVPSRDTSLKLPTGNYMALARTDKGVRGERVVSLTGTVDLRFAFGISTINDLFIIPENDWDPRFSKMLEEPKFQSAMDSPDQSSRLLSYLATGQISNGGEGTRAASPLYGMQVSTNIAKTFTCEIMPGDTSPYDTTTGMERSEIKPNAYGTYGETIGYGEWIKIDELPWMDSARFIILAQLRYVYGGSGDDPGVSPEFSLKARPTPDNPVEWFLEVTTRSGLAAGTLAQRPEVKRLLNYRMPLGKWVYISAEVRPSPTGTGICRVWVNKTGVNGDQIQVVNVTNIPIGYTDCSSTHLGIGAYSTKWNARRIVRHHRLDFGTSIKAQSMVTNPPPRVIT